MGRWLERLDDETAAKYVAQCLYESSDTVFWDIVKQFDLKAASPVELGRLVLPYIEDFDPDGEAPRDRDWCAEMDEDREDR